MAIKTGNSRAFDLSLPGNRFVLGLAPVAGAVAGLATLIAGEGLLEALSRGVSSGGAFFIAWAIARELHPQRPWIAGVAAVVAPFGLLLGTPDLLASGLVLVAGRALAGTTGRASHWVDVAVMLLLAGFLSARAAAPGTLFASAVAVGCTAALQDRRRRHLVLAGVVMTCLAVGSLMLGDHTLVWEWMPVSVVGLGLGLVALLGPTRVDVGTDRRGGEIDPRRVRAARLFAVVAASAAMATSDVAAVVPVLAATSAVALRPT